ncbi:aldehyde dehydrogenase [Caenispirillum salinarum]|uniref:aldehyde dehydrogenase n=1 Tax=Caenispirillum salinarum TaxID=859058 RepID=UPI00030CC353|nr:aldehyde dehydrogenase [Caenispirillum salinarum]
MNTMVGAVVLAAAGSFLPAAAQAQDEDFGGLPEGEGRETVFYTCTACHSTGIITQQGMSRDRWDKLLVWMVEKQGMPELAPEDRDVVLDYLAEHFPEDRGGTMAGGTGGMGMGMGGGGMMGAAPPPMPSD